MNVNLDLLAFRFFKLFAQYEFTLKENGFFHADRSGNVIVDWDSIANKVIGKSFKDDLGDLASAAESLLDQPPKRQMVEGGRVVWVDVPATDKSVQILFGHISRVRNNLFHGAKFNGTWFDPTRSETLLTNSLSVLERFRQKAGV